ncbi:MAG TPA: ATP-binding protein [Noviherbaspirillum sp.]
MDGFERRLKDSIQRRLSFWLSVTILGLALVAGVFSFVSAFDEAHELQDDVLRQVAALLNEHQLHATQETAAGRLADSDGDSRVFVQLLSEIPASPDASPTQTPVLPATLHEGLQTVSAGRESFRVLVKTLPSGGRVAFAQQTEVRDEIARDSALRTLMPFLILLPILLLLVADLVRKIFKPVAALSREIDQRSEQDLYPLVAAPLPLEIRPFVVAINRLLGRVSQSMEAQRRFIADAAHELRSPLTALSLQAERLAGAEMSDQARERLGALRQGIERGRSLLDQLLALARAQSSSEDTATSVSVQQVYRRVLEDLMPLAEAKNINIGVVGDLDVRVRAGEVDLVMIVKNLVDNAIRYTPAGGQVDLSVQTAGDEMILQIDDSGPGIPPDEWDKVFDPFHRLLGNEETGSGLGLSIVKAIASRIGAQVVLGHANEKTCSGLSARVVFSAVDGTMKKDPCRDIDIRRP